MARGKRRRKASSIGELKRTMKRSRVIAGTESRPDLFVAAEGLDALCKALRQLRHSSFHEATAVLFSKEMKGHAAAVISPVLLPWRHSGQEDDSLQLNSPSGLLSAILAFLHPHEALSAGEGLLSSIDRRSWWPLEPLDNAPQRRRVVTAGKVVVQMLLKLNGAVRAALAGRAPQEHPNEEGETRAESGSGSWGHVCWSTVALRSARAAFLVEKRAWDRLKTRFQVDAMQVLMVEAFATLLRVEAAGKVQERQGLGRGPAGWLSWLPFRHHGKGVQDEGLIAPGFDILKTARISGCVGGPEARASAVIAVTLETLWQAMGPEEAYTRGEEAIVQAARLLNQESSSMGSPVSPLARAKADNHVPALPRPPYLRDDGIIAEARNSGSTCPPCKCKPVVQSSTREKKRTPTLRDREPRPSIHDGGISPLSTADILRDEQLVHEVNLSGGTLHVSYKGPAGHRDNQAEDPHGVGGESGKSLVCAALRGDFTPLMLLVAEINERFRVLAAAVKPTAMASTVPVLEPQEILPLGSPRPCTVPSPGGPEGVGLSRAAVPADATNRVECEAREAEKKELVPLGSRKGEGEGGRTVEQQRPQQNPHQHRDQQHQQRQQHQQQKRGGGEGGGVRGGGGSGDAGSSGPIDVCLLGQMLSKGAFDLGALQDVVRSMASWLYDLESPRRHEETQRALAWFEANVSPEWLTSSAAQGAPHEAGDPSRRNRMAVVNACTSKLPRPPSSSMCKGNTSIGAALALHRVLGWVFTQLDQADADVLNRQLRTVSTYIQGPGGVALERALFAQRSRAPPSRPPTLPSPSFSRSPSLACSPSLSPSSPPSTAVRAIVRQTAAATAAAARADMALTYSLPRTREWVGQTLLRMDSRVRAGQADLREAEIVQGVRRGVGDAYTALLRCALVDSLMCEEGSTLSPTTAPAAPAPNPPTLRSNGSGRGAGPCPPAAVEACLSQGKATVMSTATLMTLGSSLSPLSSTQRPRAFHLPETLALDQGRLLGVAAAIELAAAAAATLAMVRETLACRGVKMAEASEKGLARRLLTLLELRDTVAEDYANEAVGMAMALAGSLPSDLVGGVTEVGGVTRRVSGRGEGKRGAMGTTCEVGEGAMEVGGRLTATDVAVIRARARAVWGCQCPVQRLFANRCLRVARERLLMGGGGGGGCGLQLRAPRAGPKDSWAMNGTRGGVADATAAAKMATSLGLRAVSVYLEEKAFSVMLAIAQHSEVVHLPWYNSIIADVARKLPSSLP